MATTKPFTLDPIPAFPDIILAMHLIDTVGPRFHWQLFIQDPNPESISGYKCHAIVLGETWEYECTPYPCIF